MNIHIALQNPSNAPIPSITQLQSWVENAVATVSAAFSPEQQHMTLRIVDEEESARLNEQYRHKTGPTNILSFTDDPIPGFHSDSLGELVICATLVVKEAQAQGKQVDCHWAHLLVHGVLHLAGHDHEADEAATIMENLEIRILTNLGYDDP